MLVVFVSFKVFLCYVSGFDQSDKIKIFVFVSGAFILYYSQGIIRHMCATIVNILAA